MEKDRYVPEEEKKKLKRSTLIKSGGVISGIGTITIIEAFATEQGALGPLGLLIGGVGVSLILTGVRRKK